MAGSNRLLWLRDGRLLVQGRAAIFLLGDGVSLPQPPNDASGGHVNCGENECKGQIFHVCLLDVWVKIFYSRGAEVPAPAHLGLTT